MKAFSVAIVALVAVASAAPLEEPIAILSQTQELNPDGSFHSQWETANGISFREEGVLKNPGKKDEATAVQGSAKWTAPDGTLVELGWTADENGVKFTGSHLPVAPEPAPIPPAIQRALDWAASHPWVEPDQRKKKL